MPGLPFDPPPNTAMLFIDEKEFELKDFEIALSKMTREQSCKTFYCPPCRCMTIELTEQEVLDFNREIQRNRDFDMLLWSTPLRIEAQRRIANWNTHFFVIPFIIAIAIQIAAILAFIIALTFA